MYHSILVPLDGSQTAEQALALAYDLAQHTQSTLHLLHVYVPYTTEPISLAGVPVIDEHLHSLGRSHPPIYLDRVCAELSKRGNVIITTAVRDRDGSIANTILNYATTIHSDLIVLTTHGRSGFERLWLGSVADMLVRHSTIPLLIVRAQHNPPEPAVFAPITQIMVPLDGSPLAESVLEHAHTLGETTAAAYTLLHVVTPARLHEHSPFFTPVDIDPQRTTEHQTEAQQYLDQIVPRLDAAARTRTLVIAAPHPAQAIVAEAQRTGACIAMATHGHGGLRRLLLGSVADKVLRSAETPVLLYRPPDE